MFKANSSKMSSKINFKFIIQIDYTNDDDSKTFSIYEILSCGFMGRQFVELPIKHD